MRKKWIAVIASALMLVFASLFVAGCGETAEEKQARIEREAQEKQAKAEKEAQEKQAKAEKEQKEKEEKLAAEKEKYQTAYNEVWKQINEIDRVGVQTWQNLWVEPMTGLGNGTMTAILAYQKIKNCKKEMFDISNKLSDVKISKDLPKAQRKKIEEGISKMKDGYNVQGTAASDMSDALGDGKLTPKVMSDVESYLKTSQTNKFEGVAKIVEAGQDLGLDTSHNGEQ